MLTQPLRIHLPHEQATRALGARLATLVRPAMSLHLVGDIGAGKTTLARGLIAGLGFQGKVKSPSYALVELYELSRLDLYHFDFFRLQHPEEWHEAGFRELFTARALCVVEWPEKASLLPPPDMRITLAPAGDGRDAIIEGVSEAGQQCLEPLRAP